MSLRDQIAARRAATTKQSAGRLGASGAGGADEPTAESAIRKAARSGKLDLASLHLDRLPAQVYTDLLGVPLDSLSRPPSPPSDQSPALPSLGNFDSALSLAEASDRGFGANGVRREPAWTEPEELTNLRACDNAISEIEREIGGFGGLKSVDLSKNRIATLPDSFADLLRITSLDLSHNALSAVPPSILLVPALQILNLSNNALESLSFTSPVPPSDEGMSYGAGFLSTSFSRSSKAPTSIWPALVSLNLGNNRLTNAAIDELRAAGVLPRIRSLNLQGNALRGELDLDDAVELVTLNVENMRGVTGVKCRAGVEVKHAGTSWGLAVPGLDAAVAAAAATSSPGEPAGPALPVPEPSTTIVYRTLPAASFHAEPLALKFDLYLPPKPAANGQGHPMVIWWHGGGLLQGRKENLPPHFRRLPTHAYGSGDMAEHVAVISPNYRLAPQAPVLDILSDSSALITFVRTRLNDHLAHSKEHSAYKLDVDRICLSGGSAGGYLALIAGLPAAGTDEAVGGYRGELDAHGGAIRCLAPFYPISDLTHAYWATKTDPVPWWPNSIAHETVRPFLNPRDPPSDSAVWGEPRSMLYMYMLQHALFPSLLFQAQKLVGHGLDAFRPTPESLSIPQRLRGLKGERHVPVYMVVGSLDDKVQPLGETAELLEKTGETKVDWLDVDHGFDEEPHVECESFRTWLGEHLL
ncbi:hypothetical protein Q5752_002037 [Cryptotrichosporon argae]